MSTKPDLKNLRILSLTAENVKRLQAIHIRPDGNVVQITGRNKQGKSSVLDTIWWVLEGAGNIQSQPIRRGQQKAFGSLDLGPIVVTRTLTRRGETDYTTQITVESAEGALYRSPQTLLDSLLGAHALDPLKFARMKPAEQFDAARQFVPGVDFAAIDGLNLTDKTRRTKVNAVVEDSLAAAALIHVAPDTPQEPIDKAELLTRLAQAHTTNNNLVQAREERRKVEDWLTEARAASAAVETNIAQAMQESEGIRDDSVADYTRRIDELQIQIEQLRGAIEKSRALCRDVIEKNSARLRAQDADLRAKIGATEERLRQIGPIPPNVEVEPINAQILAADRVNAAVAQAAMRARHLRIAEEHKQESEALTLAMKQRTHEKQEAIAAAALPVPGLGFGEGIVLLNGLPFDQASDAEQLTASVLLAMAAEPALRVIRIRDGSLLDADAMGLLEQMAEAHDFQVWVERVDGSGTVGFVIEDGLVRKAEATEEATA